MRVICRCLSVAVVVAYVAQHAAAQRSPATSASTLRFIDLDADTSRQVVVDREAGQYLGHPSTLLLEDGQTILAVYPKGHGSGAIIYKRSTDGGKTWSERLPTPSSWATSRETPTLHRVIDAQGKKRIIMFSGLYPVRMAITEDDGATWSELAKVGDWGGIVAMSSVVALTTGAGHYMALFHDDGRFFANGGKASGVFTLYKSLSTDGGRTWSPPQAVYQSGDVHLCEPGAIRSPNGKQIAVLLRENRRAKNSHVMFSDDEGKTWSTPRMLPAALNGDRHVARYAPDGRLLISFRDYAPRGTDSPTNGDWVAWVGRYEDIVAGRDGQYRVRLKDNTNAWDAAYPGVELLRDGTFVLTTYGHWTANQPAYELSVRLTLNELDAHASALARRPSVSSVSPAVRNVRNATKSIDFTTTEGTWLSLDLSPDGTRIVFEMLGDIYSMSSSGGDATRLLAGPAFQSQPRYAPDGRSITYISDATGSDNVWMASADGSAPRALTARHRATLQSPAWSADGRAIFVTVIDGAFARAAEMWRIDVASGAETRVVENANGAAAPLISSPAPGPYSAAPTSDGSLYFTSVTPRPYGSRNGATSAVMRRDATGAMSRVHLEGANAMKPVLSRDGQWLVYVAAYEGGTGLKVRDMSNGSERWLHRALQRNQLEARADRDVMPNYAVTADGRSVIIEIDGRIHRLGVLDGTDTVIPFAARVAMEIPAPFMFPQRIDTGAVRARRIQHMAIARDGRVAYSTLGRIFVRGVDGKTITRLTRAERPREFMPSWSPDGQFVAYVTWDERGGALWKARVDGKADPIRLTTAPAFWADPAFTPDGRALIALTAPLGTARQAPTTVPPDANIVRIDANVAGTPQRLAPANGLRHPHFARDSQRVLLSSPQAGLVSFALNGSERRSELRLARDGGAGDLWLSPDGAHVLARIGARALRFPAPSGGAAGVELASKDGVVLSSDDPTAVAWHGASTPAWVRGVTLVRGMNENAPDSSSLGVRVARPHPTGALALRGARVITMRGDEVIANADVVVTGERITAVGARGSVTVPVGARVIDVTGKTIVPGFVDIHAHLGLRPELIEAEGTPTFANLAYGVTTVRDPQVAADVFSLADIVEADAVPSPRIMSTGPAFGLAGGGTREFLSLDDVRRAMRQYRDEYDTRYLKSYLAGTRQQRQWVAQAAGELGIMATTEGGSDTKADITHALDGYSGNEHAFPVAPIRNDLVQFLARSGITYTPTLLVAFGGALPIYRLLADERPYTQRVNRWFPDGELYQRSATRLLAFPAQDYNDRDIGAGIAAILRAGGNIGMGGHGEVQGLSAHWEMMLLANGGLTPHDVLRVSTLAGARALGLETDLGSIEVGKLADLVVLDRNPLSDIRNTTSTTRVMRGGVLYDAETLDEVAPTPRTRVTPWFLARAQTAVAGDVARIDRTVQRLMDRLQVPGVGVAVVKQGRVLLAKGYGMANLEHGVPVTTETMFESGSLGKQFTAAGVMALVEDGNVSLDASVRTYLTDAPASWQPITVRHLLTHTSGIPDYTSGALDYRKTYTEADLLRLAYALPLEFAPAARWNYSNTGYVLLGILLHQVTGKPYADFLRARIFTPARMPTIRLISEAAIVPHRASGYLVGDDGYRHHDWVSPELNTTADGSMLLSLVDMIAWNDVVSRRAVLKPESWAVLQGPARLRSGKTYPYGMGWFVDSLRGEQVLQHGGAWQGFRTQYTRFAHGDLAVIVLANSRTASTDVFANEIAAEVDSALRAPGLPTQPIVDREPATTATVSAALVKAAHNALAISDFSSVRQTTFPRLQALLARLLTGLDAPDRLDLLSRNEVGDDVASVYRATYGAKRLIVRVSLSPDGKLAALLVSPDER